MQLNDITGQIVDASLKIHREFGPGLLESIYETLLVNELKKRGLEVQRQVPLHLIYDGRKLGEACRADLIVQARVIVELKSTEQPHPVHKKQVKTQLKLSGLPVGLLINFGLETLKEGIERIVNELPDSDCLKARTGELTSN